VDADRTANSRNAPWPFWLRAVILTIAIACWCYAFARAQHVAFTYDESLTMRLVDRPLYEIVTFTKPIANNHVVNTILIQASRRIFGHGELVYRLPNLAAFALFLTVAMFLARRMSTPLTSLAAYVALVANPYLWDFFSLARGYGLALGFQLTSTLGLLMFLQTPRRLSLVLSLSAGALAVWSNFAWAGFYVALVCVYAALAREMRRKEIAAVLAVVTMPLAVLVTFPAIKLSRAGELYFGGHRSLWRDTAGSLLDGTIYDAGYSRSIVTIVAIVLGAILLVSTVMAVRTWRSSGYRLRQSPGFVLAILFFVPAAIAAIQHAALGTPWPMGRTALVFVPSFVLLAIEAWAGPPAGKLAARLREVAAPLTVAVVGLHAVSQANLIYAHDWRYNADVKTVVDTLEQKHRAAAGDAPMRLLMSWPFEESVLFYQRERGLTWLRAEVVDAAADKERYDFYYGLTRDQEFGFKADPKFASSNADLIERCFPLSESCLVRRH
jgi:hypothetical protein